MNGPPDRKDDLTTAIDAQVDIRATDRADFAGFDI